MGDAMAQAAENAANAEYTINALLIDTAGGSAMDKDIDHFVNLGTANRICPRYTATALSTLQKAPTGCASQRINLPGAGPLTSLLKKLSAARPLHCALQARPSKPGDRPRRGWDRGKE